MRARKTTRNGERIVATIRERIFKWVYPPNHPLGEESLSREFGVSRSPVREALRTLEAEGLVHRINARGYFVRQFKTEEVEELYVVRLALELYAVEWLAGHAEAHGQVAELASPWREVMAGVRPADPESLALVDEEFHTRLAALTGNRMLLQHLEQINARLFVFRSMDFTFVVEQDGVAESCANHLALLDAICRGDVTRAREDLRANLLVARGNAEKSMGRILAKTFNADAM